MITHSGLYTGAAIAALAFPLTVAAQETESSRVFSSGGHAYDITCNENGFILASRYPTFRLIENGVFSTVVEGIETVYLGKSCDAYTESYGDGSWG